MYDPFRQISPCRHPFTGSVPIALFGGGKCRVTHVGETGRTHPIPPRSSRASGSPFAVQRQNATPRQGGCADREPPDAVRQIAGPVRHADRQRGHLLQLGHPVEAADEVRSEWERQGASAHHPDFTGGLAAHPAERALHLPERRQDARPGCARGGAGVGMAEISAVPAYNPYHQLLQVLAEGKKRYIAQNTLVVKIYRLRRILEDTGAHRCLETIPGFGYRFCPPRHVARLAEQSTQ